MAARKALLAAAVLAQAAWAQQSAYGQCGGIGWSGPTTCASGWTCIASGSYYSQCLPGGPATSAPPPPPPPPPTTTQTTSAVNGCGGGPVTTPSPTKGTTTPVSTSPAPTTKPVTTPTTAPSPTATATISGNPFAGYQLYANPYYSSEIYASAIPSMAAPLATKASAVAKVGTFMWMDTASKVPLFETYMGNIAALNAAGASPPIVGTFVVYDLPDRDCAAAASNGEYSIANGGVAKYKAYINSIAAVVKTYSNTKVIFIIEPDSLANLVTNLNSAYLECVTYAIQQLNLPNVAMYLDAGHAGWLGWPANIGPAATLFGTLYKNAGKPSAVRGLATNVANYNGWNLASAPPYTSSSSPYDEKLYVNAFAPLLTAAGFPAHFITDTSRNGVQPTAQNAWGDWCNVIGAGFGVRPTTDTGDVLEDAFVWIKPGGECDGTSNTSSPRYDFHCGLSDALQPAPEAGTWFEAYFAQLLTNANPPF